MQNEITHCPITHIVVNNFKETRAENGDQSFSFRVDFPTLGEKQFHYLVRTFPEVQEILRGKADLVYAHLLNGKEFDYSVNKGNYNYITVDVLSKFIKDHYYPKSLKDKKENLLMFLYNKTAEAGQKINTQEKLWKELGWRKLYFKSEDECNFYIRFIESSGLIEADYLNPGREKGGLAYQCNLTFQGLDYALKIQEEGLLSNKCFVAMRFNEGTKSIREAIRNTVFDTGFTPIFIDENIPEPERTINDEMIAKMKVSKFAIADFTFQNQGVYFESGFMMGQGKRVIFTCQKEWFKGIDKEHTSHFDTDHFMHIIYTDETELKKRLKDHIAAWIK